MTAAKKVVATQTFVTTIRKVEYLIREGDELPANHPAAKARPEKFKAA